MSERISGGLLCAMAGAAELWLIKSIRSMARLCATIPTGCLPEIAGAQQSEPRRNPAQRPPGKLFDLIFTATRTRIRENCDVRLSGDSEFAQHRASVLAIIPNRHEIKFHLWIFIDRFGPAAGLELGLTVGAPRGPEMNDSGLWRFDRGENFILRRRLRVQGTSQRPE